MSGRDEIRLVGPGGAGKSTIGAVLAGRLGLAFVDLDRHLAGRIGDIGDYIGEYGYTHTRETTSRRIACCNGERSALEWSRCLPAS